MRQCHFRAICIVISAALLFFAGPWRATARAGEPALPLLVFNRPPYYVLQHGKPVGGFLLDIALDIFELAGIPVEVREMPASRILATFEAKDIAACGVGWLHLPERESFARFSLPIYTNKPLGVVVNRDKAKAFGPKPHLEDLLRADLSWGHRQHYSHGPDLDAALHTHPNLRVTRFTDLPPILRLIALGRLDATLLAPEELASNLAAEPALADSLVLLPLADAPPAFTRHIMCDAGTSQEIMARIDAAITTYLQTDRYRQRLAACCPGPDNAVH